MAGEEWLDPLFVGRERELDWLSRQTRGRSKAIVLTGPRGIGKTTLLTRYLYGAESRSWVCWNLHPDPASVEALLINIGELYDKTNATEIVAIDNAETLSDDTASQLVSRILNIKRIKCVILVSSKQLSIPRAETLILTYSGPGNGSLPAGKIYDLDHGLLLPERRLIADLKPRIVLANQSLAERLQAAPQSVSNLSPRQFEELIAELLEDFGCDVHLTPTTRDGGKDILAYMPTALGRILCLVEAKRYRQDRPVGVGLVRQLYGTLADAGATNAMLVTTSSFSKDARAFRNKHQYRLDLRGYADVIEWIKGYRRNNQNGKLP